MTKSGFFSSLAGGKERAASLLYTTAAFMSCVALKSSAQETISSLSVQIIKGSSFAGEQAEKNTPADSASTAADLFRKLLSHIVDGLVNNVNLILFKT